MSNPANSITTEVLEELTSIAVQEARLASTNRQDLRTLILNLDKREGDTGVKFPLFSGMEATAKTAELSEIPLQDIDVDGPTLTPGINASLASLIGDLAAHNAPQIVAGWARASADAILRKINQDIFGLGAGLSRSLGSSSSPLTTTLLTNAVTRLLESHAPGPYYALITPRVWQDLIADLRSPTGGNSLVSDQMRDRIMSGVIDPGFVVHGVVPVVVTSAIAQTGSVSIPVISEWAFGYARAWDYKVEFGRVPRRNGYEAVATACYAVGEIDDNMGVRIVARADASAT